jgi:hypothetical protein
MEHSSPQNINSLFEAAFDLQNFLKSQGLAFCFIGGLAVLRWGEIRMTQDIDLCLSCGFGKEEKNINPLLKKYPSRIHGAEQFALENRVLLLQSPNGVSMDISLSGLPFEEEMISRADYFSFTENCPLLTCSAEDLIVLKAFADRPKDWADVEGIIIHQGYKLDKSYILNQLTPLSKVKEDSAILQKLAALFRSQSDI